MRLRGRDRGTIAASLGFASLGLFGSLASAGVEDFEFESFAADYYLGISEDGRAMLEACETLIPVFPEFDQNRGLVRYLPNWYGRIPLETKVLSLTDDTGQARPLEVIHEGEYTMVDSVVPEGQYLYGRQVFVLDYTMVDVVGDFSDSTGVQEFYWDINGTGWQQRFGVVQARIVVPADIAQGFIPDRTSCYWGSEGATNQCEVSIADSPEGTVVTVAQKNLGPGQTVTVALAFQPDTFVVPQRNPDEFFGNWLMVVLLVGLIAIVLPWSVVYRVRFLRDQGPIRATIAEYLPPKGLSLGEAATLLKRQDRHPTAALLELAVSGKVLLREYRRGKWDVTATGMPLELADEKVLRALLGTVPTPEHPVKIRSATASTRRALVAVHQEWTSHVYATYTAVPNPDRRMTLRALTLATAGGSIGLAIWSFFQRIDHPLAPVAIGVALVGGFLAMGALSKRPLNEAGSTMKRHLMGLRLYMKLAEEDRLEYLQSPDGALRVGDAEYLKLHERLLPWAVLLGLGRSWMKELARHYGDSSPNWITSGYRSDFSRGFGSFSSAMASSFASSSSGGSGGGGSAGGGGGGGGGGGR